jgi:hypothetical protein
MDLMDLDPATVGALYSPLATSDAFRLMVLQPGKRHDPIVVQLRALSATSVPEYDALSYVWGDPQAVIPILVNGIPTPITVNLHAALVQVRSPHTSRVLWTDALCINQQDPQERSQQVIIMGSIYARARLVLACMGTSPDGGAGRIASFLNDYAPVMRSGAVPPTQDSRWRSFGPLLRKPWFTRAWVLQEVGLAKDPRVVYDDVDFSYRDLMAAVKWLTFYDSAAPATLGIPGLLIHTLWTDWSDDNWNRDPFLQHCGLLDLLDHAALLDCQDPRDRIYAFLGHPLAVAAGTTGTQIIPDYQKEVNQVYKEATVFLLGQTSVRTLSSAEHDDMTLADFTIPSWVIRWDVCYVTNNINVHPSAPYRSCGSRSVSQLSLQGDVLHIVGVQVDTVKEVYQMQLRNDSYKILFTNRATGQVGRLENLISHLTDSSAGLPRAYAEPLGLSLARTLCVGQMRGAETSSFLEAWNAFRSWNHPNLVSKVALISKSGAVIEKLWHLMITGCQGRALVVTDAGRLGLASHCSRPGDVCCVFDGGSVPFILRPAQPRGNDPNTAGDHRFVGEAYVHGLMQGEAVSLLERGEAEERTFRIF